MSGVDEETMRQRLGLGLSGVPAGEAAPKQMEKMIKQEADEDEEL